jgi:uridine phosphorylase
MDWSISTDDCIITDMNLILHITTRSDWETAVSQASYTTESLQTDGFIHCSTPAQAVYAANEHFQGQTGLMLLCIDEDLVTADVVYEDCYETGMKFPHVYGSLNLDAVLGVVDFPSHADGSFRLPPLINLAAAPILNYDPNPVAVLQPDKLLKKQSISEYCVLCFFQDVITSLVENGRLTQIYELKSERGPNPVYEMEVEGKRIVVAHPEVGSATAGASMEEIIALGCRKIIAAGGCGVLDGSIGAGHVVIPTTAVRDEGTSYHYLPAYTEVSASETAVAAIKATLEQHHIPYDTGKTWTTDGIYRETRKLITQRQTEGCLTVEMEAATFFAIAQFRGITFGQILYGGDNLAGDEWDHRGWQQLNSTREKLFWLAVEACLSLP